MNTLLHFRRTGRSAGHYYSRAQSSGLDSARSFVGAVILFIIAPLFVSLAGGSLVPFGILMGIESIGILWGFLRFKWSHEPLPPLNLLSHERAVEDQTQQRKAA